MTKEIVLIDMVSHSEMHLPFNEGYLKAVSLAYPDKRITFAAFSIVHPQWAYTRKHGYGR